MCGIAGVFGGRLNGPELASALAAMNAAQFHRGPDEAGTFVCEPLRSGLASCRLSIIDLEHGRQPIANEDGTIHVVLNGEIYNHGSLRQLLLSKGHTFRSRSDAEVLVHLYEEMGDGMLDRLEGMFALAVLDSRGARLLLARDGPGMKPLYLAETPRGFAFASEAKALFASGLVAPRPNLAAVDAYLAAGYVPAPLSMFQGVLKLPAGEYLVVDGSGARQGTFWRPCYRRDERPKSDAEYSEELGERLDAAVRSHLAADVPVGAFLSGGWDSSLTTALAARVAGSRLKTFSVVFPDDPEMDESRFSRLLASRLGTDHHEIEYRSSDLPAILPKLIHHLEEPCTTAPAGVVFQLASLAARHVKAVISGEGADELFGGYKWVRVESPYVIRNIAPRGLFRQLGPWCPHSRLRKLMRILGAAEDRAADVEWRRLFTPGGKRELLKPEFRNGGPDVQPFLISDGILATCTDSLQRRLASDLASRLAEGLLFMGDKVSMAHSLEVRMPFLDRAVVDFALRLPSRMKVRRGKEKRVLAGLVRRHLPQEIAERRKHGLGYPRSMWKNAANLAFARQLLLDSSDGPFLLPALERRLAGYQKGGFAHGLSNLVFLQSWWNEFVA